MPSSDKAGRLTWRAVRIPENRQTGNPKNPAFQEELEWITSQVMLNSLEIQRVFRMVPGLLVVLKPDARFTIVGASADYLRVLHVDTSIYGRGLFDVFPENAAQEQPGGMRNVEASLALVMAQRVRDAMATQRYDVRRPAEPGESIGAFEERYWNVVNSPVLGEDGEIQYIVQQVEEATAKASRSAIGILESITEGFFTLDRQWRFDYVNREAHVILEREFGDLSGQRLWDAYPGLAGTEFERNYHRTMHEREKTTFVAFYTTQGRWYDVTTFPSPEGVSVFFRDVTRQKNLEAERERLEAESEKQRRIYETALDSIPDFVYVFDVGHRVLYANDALLKTWGVDDARGRSLSELRHSPAQAAFHEAEMDRVVATGLPVRGEVPFRSGGAERVQDYIFVPVLNAQGQVVAVAGSAHDITERQAADQALREQAERLAQADRAKDEFLATLSHELRNPLAPLRTAIELLRRAGNADDRSVRLHAMMDRQITHMVRLVDDLLEMSRISRGTLSLRTERVALATVVGSALDTSDPLIKAAGHVLTVELPAEPVWLNGDPVRLAQVLANLLNNAAKYTDDNGRIGLRAWHEPGGVAIGVRDNGLGIEAELLPRLFEMFSRGHRHSGRHQGGLGIGLALSQRLVRMHGGSLDVRSDGPDRGSDFIVHLPVAESNPPVVVAPCEPGSGLARARILVIDDNRDAADSLGMLLSALDADVRVAHDGACGLELHASWHPTIVLLDIGMPGMDGYEVARTIRSRDPAGTTTLVALTGWGQEEDRHRGREAGFDYHLVKPADLNALQRLFDAREPSPS
jgi:PAS domain S-box-containing protein